MLVERDESEVREFLMDMRQYVSGRISIYSIDFLCKFVNINPITWSDAWKLLHGKFTLKELAFQCLCRSKILLSYIQKRCPFHIYDNVEKLRDFNKVQKPANVQQILL